MIATAEKKALFWPKDRLRVEVEAQNPLLLILDVYSLDANNEKTRYGTSYHASTGFIRDIPEASFQRSFWSVPLKPAVVRAVNSWPEDQVIYQSDSLKQRMQECLVTESLLLENTKIQTRWKEENIIPEMEVHPERPLKPYQKVGTALLEHPVGYGLFAEQGCGKTPMSIAAICNEVKKRKEQGISELMKVLIVVPPALKINWEEEIASFETRNGFTHILTGMNHHARIVDMMKALATANAQKSDFCAIITTYDIVVNSISLFTTVNWDMCFADEAQNMKDPRTARAKAMLKLRDSCKKRVPLTGTPIGNSLLDLYVLLEFMEPGASGHSSFHEFKRMHAVTETVGQGIEAIIGTKCEPELQAILAQRAFIVKKKDVLEDLPERTFEYNEVEMAPDQAAHYKMMATQLIAQIESELRSSTASVTHALTQLLRLAQITAGFIVTDAEYENDELVIPKEIRYYNQNNKITRLIEIANELPPNEKMVVWNHWIPMVYKIKDALELAGNKVALFRGSGDNRQAAVDAFNKDKDTKIFLANAQSAGAGLSLLGYDKGNPDHYDTNCTTMVYYSYNWSWIQRSQSMDRSHRIGTRKQIRVIDLVVPNSIDMEIIKALRSKKELSDRMTEVQDLVTKISKMIGIA